MTALLLRLYDYLHRHPRLRWTLLVLLLLFMGGSVATLHFKEDITDFLPLSPQHRRAMSAPKCHEQYHPTFYAPRLQD